MFVRCAVEFDHDPVEGPRVVEFGADQNGSDFVGHGRHGAVHAEPMVFGLVSVTEDERLVLADRGTGWRCAAADMSCVRGDFNFD
jgi:hypothetical protein